MGALERLGIRPSVNPTDNTDATTSASQRQTENAFGFKWSKRDTYESPAVTTACKNWLLDRYCDGHDTRLDSWLGDQPGVILDAGCGAAVSAILLFGDRLKTHDYLGVDISAAVEVAEQRFRERGYPGDFLRADIMNLPLPDNSVDMIFSEGVLHHTDDTGRAIRSLTTKLKPGGFFLFYVYAKKALIREFTDDAIRQYLSNLSDEEAWRALEPLTKLGSALGELDIEFEVPEDIPYLGISKGKTNLQRFFYYNICKAFYKPEFSKDEMNHVNFDWFRPLNCHRHTPEEVRLFCKHAGLTIEQMNVEPSGITVVARKNG